MILAFALLATILSMLSTRIQSMLRRWHGTTGSLLISAAALACVFCAAAAYYGVLSVKLGLLVFAYLFSPAICVSLRGSNRRANMLDFAAILLLWLPLEFAVGGDLVPRPVQGRLHAIAYGVALTLALIMFLIYRRFEGMKYNFPRRLSDLGIAGVGFLSAVVVLIPVGLLVGFMGPAHWPKVGLLAAMVRVFLIFGGSALPEELLFRSLIQNWLMQRLGATNAVVALAALIFGLAHLNNGPGAGPNWPYAIVASLAGFIFGKVFQRSTSVLSSAFVHTGVNTVKYLFF